MDIEENRQVQLGFHSTQGGWPPDPPFPEAEVTIYTSTDILHVHFYPSTTLLPPIGPLFPSRAFLGLPLGSPGRLALALWSVTGPTGGPLASRGPFSRLCRAHRAKKSSARRTDLRGPGAGHGLGWPGRRSSLRRSVHRRSLHSPLGEESDGGRTLRSAVVQLGRDSFRQRVAVFILRPSEPVLRPMGRSAFRRFESTSDARRLVRATTGAAQSVGLPPTIGIDKTREDK